MSAPVNLAPYSLKNEEAPAFVRGLLRSTLRFLSARARPRLSKANKAQESKEEYERAGRLGHVDFAF